MNNSDYSELHILQDPTIDLQAVICLHQQNRGPALGGCRFIEYNSLEAAILDAIRLSKAMLHKAIMSHLPHDGGKAVIVRKKNMNTTIVLKRFAEFVDSLNGKYIATLDSGTTPNDMSFMQKFTPYVIGEKNQNLPDVAHSTALGVVKGMQAAAKIVYHRETLQGLHIAIQGAGSVGYHLAKILHQHGARLSVCDLNPRLVARCVKEFQATTVSSQQILSIPCDILSPCALGFKMVITN